MTRRCVPLLGFVGIALLAVWSVVQNLVLNPLATAPERTLSQVHADVAAAGESLDVPIVVGSSGWESCSHWHCWLPACAVSVQILDPMPSASSYSESWPRRHIGWPPLARASPWLTPM
ncbi:hypothetical protein [Luteococcus sp. OSA5]|uniref:hypothetical protein n=1 Tax=Luteococcus sp. OSA5 TaxID=3401630 RepID=UPI003B43C196